MEHRMYTSLAYWAREREKRSLLVEAVREDVNPNVAKAEEDDEIEAIEVVPVVFTLDVADAA